MPLWDAINEPSKSTCKSYPLGSLQRSASYGACCLRSARALDGKNQTQVGNHWTQGNIGLGVENGDTKYI